MVVLTGYWRFLLVFVGSSCVLVVLGDYWWFLVVLVVLVGS